MNHFFPDFLMPPPPEKSNREIYKKHLHFGYEACYARKDYQSPTIRTDIHRVPNPEKLIRYLKKNRRAQRAVPVFFTTA